MSKETKDIRIVFLQRGNVIVGNFRREGMHCYITGGSVIRRWGTTQGIGEIAMGGPTSGTTLDAVPEVEWHELVAVMLIKCEVSKWTKHVR